MTTTSSPETGIIATAVAKTAEVWWTHYGKLVLVVISGLTGWGMTWITAWIDALPRPGAPAPPPPAIVVQGDPEVVRRLGALDATLQAVRDELAAMRQKKGAK
jgi:hypothetical protein